MVKPRLTLVELLELTTIRTCDLCKEKHAPVRSCESAALERTRQGEDK